MISSVSGISKVNGYYDNYFTTSQLASKVLSYKV